MPVVNQITVYQSAFSYNGIPHAGWLAAIVEHENVHTRQSGYVSAIVNGAQQRFLGNYNYDAGLEIEAWNMMAENWNRFELNCGMRLEIEQNIFYFDTILKNKGRGPKNEYDEAVNYTPSVTHTGNFLKHCKKEMENLSF